MKKFLLAGCLLSLGNSQLNAREVPDTVLGVGAAAVVLGVAGAAKIIKNCRAELTKSEERKEDKPTSRVLINTMMVCDVVLFSSKI